MILLVDFHVHFWLLLSKRAYLKGSSAKKAHQQKTLGGANAPSASPPAPEGLQNPNDPGDENEHLKQPHNAIEKQIAECLSRTIC